MSISPKTGGSLVGSVCLCTQRRGFVDTRIGIVDIDDARMVYQLWSRKMLGTISRRRIYVKPLGQALTGNHWDYQPLFLQLEMNEGERSLWVANPQLPFIDGIPRGTTFTEEQFVETYRVSRS
jgi:hypothetical protein